MKKFKMCGFIGIGLLFAGFLFSASNDFTDMWTIKSGNTAVAYIDSSGNMNLTGTTSLTGELSISDDDIVLGAGGSQPSTVAGTYPGFKVPIKNCGSGAWVQGTLVVANLSAVGCGETSGATNDLTTILGISEGAVAATAIGYITTEGYALALTTGTVNRGHSLVSTTGAAGYLGGTATPTTGADIGIALSSGTAAGGLTLILLR